MKRDFRLELPEFDPQALLDDEQARERYETAVRDAVRNESGWEVLSDAVLGQFSFQKLAMDDDYGRHATEIAEHEHCRRIAGDDSTPPSFAVAIPSPARFDAEVHPSKRQTIRPCDSSQLEAILAIKSGASDPPGTGKSQTIANVIAECLADGKTVLFVSEKAAALGVVKQRLKVTSSQEALPATSELCAGMSRDRRFSVRESAVENRRWSSGPADRDLG